VLGELEAHHEQIMVQMAQIPYSLLSQQQVVVEGDIHKVQMDIVAVQVVVRQLSQQLVVLE
jgi:hypothetical protein